ncbi:MAG TPA: nucleotidyltransferase [Gemmataceae bacterium]|nr:nucleotidyltransferase [Gemmataceae bacterium]
MQSTIPNPGELKAEVADFYRQALVSLTEANLPFLVGGALALRYYTGIIRHTKDLDLFVRFEDSARLLEKLAAKGYRTELTDPQWLAKVFSDEHFIDVIFASGKGLGLVDQVWFDHAAEGELFGVPVRFCPAEEIIWSKAFIMERERYDGADIAHLLRARGRDLDWKRLLQHFGSYWRVLFSHLILHGFVYPSEPAQVPSWVLAELLSRFQNELNSSADSERICRGPLLSHTQYLIDLERWGYQDGRPRAQVT